MLLVYCEHITSRHEYIFHFMLHTLCGVDFTFTTDQITYKKHTGPGLNYSNYALKENDITIKPNGLLALQTLITCEAFVIKNQDDVQILLKAAGVDSTIFDPIAASFFLLTRYEEYFPFAPDAYNRFEAYASVLFPYGLLHRALINEWAAALQQAFSNAYAQLPFRKSEFSCIITVDIDQAYAFQHRGVVKNLFSFAKNLGRANISLLLSQLQTFFFAAPDPYNTFSYLQQVQKRTGLPFVFFVNVGDTTNYDKNEPLTNKSFKTLLRTLATQAHIGIHPSYYTDSNPEKLKVEKDRLEIALEQPITKSRQHYLKLFFPDTYRHLLEAGITEDYSMGYASHPGFRAGTCTPFYWFDLVRNQSTKLLIYPITYMEGTFGEDLSLPPQQALEAMIHLINTVKKNNGIFIPIWHNHTVNDRFFWKGWKAVFEESIYYISKRRL